ncbi:hypothetical protein GCM10011349_08240 [Novosphingobium indicum]|jgi:hypothetical protein|uniref:Uncharacterized protein n=1 Tax=Novosphingobium indicum TaxID=462949 RepID=A0ABQ2JCN7_9SPHN|nr:hypothetical protein [Novosphingobium indicum]GGN43752.1 hypothetical protein GCM10011349_08240 [Novosphingobium indicum]
MIEAEADFASLTARLTGKARTLAVAHIAARALARRGDARRWRRARLLWPLFAKG